MLARVLSGAVRGIDAYLVRVEADVANGLPTFSTVGLPQVAVKEGKERVVAAIKNSGFEVPPRRYTVNLAPADVRKDGSAFDLPIAVGILAGTGQIPAGSSNGYLLLGELGLDGVLRPVRGALPIAMAVRHRRLKGLVLPAENAREASLVEGLEVRPARSLAEVARFLRGEAELQFQASEPSAREQDPPRLLDFADVRGQQHAKRAIEVAAAGLHNILMVGAPGSGKTMLARRIPGVLPHLSVGEALETANVRSVAGLLLEGHLSRTPPFRAPHHTISDAGLIGGGSNPRPGEVSLAHNGVLFLDELPEFRRNALEALRQPLEDQEVMISRAGASFTYPARFMLVAAMNPCPCGYFGDERKGCTCPPPLVQRYLARISGPLLDRIDIHIEVPPVSHEQLDARSRGDGSEEIRARVLAAREIQRARFAGRADVFANAHMRPRDLRDFCRVDRRGAGLLRSAMDRLNLSARAYHRILKIARTIADLAGAEAIASAHLAEAIQYRSLDRRG